MALSETEALTAISAWNASCVTDKLLGPFVDEHGRLFLFKCPTCGRRFVDADVGHRHAWKDHQ